MQLAPKDVVLCETTRNDGYSRFKFDQFDRKPACDSLSVNRLNTTNLRPTSHRFRVIGAYWSNYRSWQGPLFNSFVQDESLNSGLWNFTSETRKPLYSVVHKTTTYFDILDHVGVDHCHQCDRQTDRRKEVPQQWRASIGVNLYKAPRPEPPTF